LLADLARDSNQTIVMVTHDANVARSAFRLLMFRDGNIARDLNQDQFAANAQAFNVGSSSQSKSTSAGPVDPAILSEGNR
jgi:ABC-type lipoprotein export system ATPase subunit